VWAQAAAAANRFGACGIWVVGWMDCGWADFGLPPPADGDWRVRRCADEGELDDEVEKGVAGMRWKEREEFLDEENVEEVDCLQ
jgi:hypothetical protein